MATPLVNAIAEAVAKYETPLGDEPLPASIWLDDAAVAASAVIAFVATLPAEYTAVDVLAVLRGEDAPSEPLPTVEAAS